MFDVIFLYKCLVVMTSAGRVRGSVVRNHKFTGPWLSWKEPVFFIFTWCVGTDMLVGGGQSGAIGCLLQNEAMLTLELLVATARGLVLRPDGKKSPSFSLP